MEDTEIKCVSQLAVLTLNVSYPKLTANSSWKTYRAAGIGSLNPGQVLHVGVEHIHLLNQAGQGSLSSLTDLLIDLLGLEKRRVMKRTG